MGLAQQTIRPRNYGQYNEVKFDSLTSGDDANYSIWGQTSVAGRTNRQIFFPYDIVIRRMWVSMLTNGLDALSTNTWTLELTSGDTALVIPLTDASPTGVSIEIVARVPVPANEFIAVRWNSDSVGSILFRSLGMCFTAVGLPN